ncbi:hypothetical protein RUM44_007339 [Polyplax serrata]|uniref:Dopey N-terminal domain-containing protein n=1 Tax=Polyplax serrata TaxID=468196 RepID=A0ABR1B0E3_POLSC
MSSVAMEEYEVMKEAKYRLYVSAVDKALKAFESTNEWPDLISALAKLNKVLKDNQRYPVIPRRIKISKRLAQCTHFALPSGVHLKALETYDTIFKCMGTNRLSHELFIYSAGLFPLFGHSAMNVKPLLLTIYETHFVPLGRRLRPGLSGFLSGVLPGLEEGSDHFDRTNSLLEEVCDGVGSEFFYSCLWECVCYNSAIRLPAVSFVLAHFNKKLMMEEQKHIIGNNLNIMVNALCAGVQDTNVLVQRCSLDLLLVAFPMHSNLLEKSSLVDLVTSAITTVLRRDMSLNRRLYAWLLGSDLNVSQLSLDHPFLKKLETLGEVSQSTLYFETYSKDNLIQGVQASLKQQNSQSPDIRPYRLLMSLLDKQDVGPVILDNILYEVFRTLYLSCREDKFDGVKTKQEILKSANLLFSSLEPWYVWLYMGSLFDQACKVNIEELTTILEIESSMAVKSVGSGLPNIWEVCELCEFLLGVIPLEGGGDNSSEFLLHLILHIVNQLTKYIETLSPQQIARCLKLCILILSKIQPFSNVGKVRSEEKITESEQISAGMIRSRVGGEKSEPEDKTKDEKQSEPEPTKAPVSAEVGRFSTLFKNFLKQYETFYVTLVGGGRIIHNQMVPEAFEAMKKNPEGKNETDYAKELRRILTAVMNEDDTTDVFSPKKNGTQEGDGCAVEVAAQDNEKWEEAFRIACEILVGLSSFPICRVDFDLTENTVFLPWMKFMVVCACRLEKSPALHLVAIKTLLDLLSLSKLPSSKDGVMALLNSAQADFLEQNTHVLEILSRILWKHLGELSYDQQVKCIQLLYQLHGVFESDESVERILGESLLRGTENGQVEALRRFIKLWHIGREIHSQDYNQKKLFHKCLLKVLDNLLLPDNLPLKIETQSCLVQSLIKGDLPRLLDPVLLMLLDPATARMSILHVSIQHSNVGTEAQDQNYQTDENSNKIYAISSVDGNVIYHVSNSLTDKGMLSKKLKWRWKKNGKIPYNSNQRVFTVTSLQDRGDYRSCYVAKKNIQRDIELPATFDGNMSVLVNPFPRGLLDYDVASTEYPTLHTGHLNDSLKSSSVSDCSTDRNNETDILSRQPRVTLEVTTTETPPGELRFFGQLKNKLMDIAQGECEDSHSADEYFNNKKDDQYGEDGEESTSETSLEVVNSVLGSLVDIIVKNSEESEQLDKSPKPGMAVHPYHSHFLLYCGVFDSCRTLYALNTLKNLILTNSRLFLCCAASSGIVNAPFSSDLLTLLARHKKSVFGRNFHGGEKSLSEYIGIFRSNMYLEILVSVCLHFVRSYYPNLGVIKLTAEEIAGNRQVQLTSVETLTHICSELIPIVRDSGKGFANYIADMLNRCKVQKTVLYCLMASLLSIHRQQSCSTEPKSFTEEILDFNDPESDGGVNGTGMTEHSSSLQIQLLKVLQALVMLEQQIECQKVDSEGTQVKSNALESGEMESKYTPDSSIPNQPMFMKSIVTALSLKGKMRCLHYNWTELITSSLPYLGTALPQVVMVTINQICANLEELALIYMNRKSDKDEYFPPGYAVTQLEALTVLCHFCIMDSTQQVSPQPFVPPVGSNPSGIPGSNPAQILSNLVHVFTSSSLTEVSLAR